jgi:Asp-tRNA(Asn)/Glu-tRNA(Gln) amidotransferase A subunit family amidase
MTTAAEMSWDEIKALVAELAIQSKETDRRFQETEAQMRETDRKMREVFARFDNLMTPLPPRRLQRQTQRPNDVQFPPARTAVILFATRNPR